MCWSLSALCSEGCNIIVKNTWLLDSCFTILACILGSILNICGETKNQTVVNTNNLDVLPPTGSSFPGRRAVGRLAWAATDASTWRGGTWELEPSEQRGRWVGWQPRRSRDSCLWSYLMFLLILFWVYFPIGWTSWNSTIGLSLLWVNKPSFIPSLFLPCVSLSVSCSLSPLLFLNSNVGDYFSHHFTKLNQVSTFLCNLFYS